MSNADLDTLARWFGDPAFVVWWGGTPKSREEVAEKYLGFGPARQSFIVDPVALSRHGMRAFEKAGFVKIGELGEHVLLAFEPETGSV